MDGENQNETAASGGPREGATAAALYAVGVAVGVAVAAGLLDQPASLADPWVWAGLLPAVALAMGWRRGRTLWTLGWSGLGLLAFANLLLPALAIRRYGDWQEIRELVATASERSSGRWLGGLASLTGLYRAAVDHLGATPGVVTAETVIRGVGILLTVGASVALLRAWPRRLAVILPTLTPIWLLFSVGHTEYYPTIAWALLLTLAWVTAAPLGTRPAWRVGLLAALLHPFLYLGYAPIAVLLLVAYLLAAPRRAPLAALAAAAAGALTVLLLWPRGLIDFARRVYLHTGATWDATLFKPYEGHGAAPDSIYFTWRYALSPEHLLDLGLMQTVGGGVLALPLLLAALALALRSPAARRSLKTTGAGIALAALGWQLVHTVRYHAQRGPVGDVDVHFMTYLIVAFVAGLLFDAWLGAGGAARRRWAPRLLALWLGGTAVAAATLLVHGVELPRARWGGEELAAALQRSREPELVEQLLAALDAGHLVARPVGGGAGALALGVQYDRWTRGTEPAALVLHNTTRGEVLPRIELLCWAPARYLPVTAHVEDGAGPPRELTFTDHAPRHVELSALAAGERRVVSLWSDRAWPGAEREPRWLGVRIVAADLVEPAREDG